MNTEFTSEMKRGVQRLIVRKRILNHPLYIFGWSCLPLLALVGVGLSLGTAPVPYFAVLTIAFMAFMIGFITAMETKNLTIDVIQKLESYSFDSWFTVLSVNRVYENTWPVIITLRDLFGGNHKIYFSGSVGKIDLDDRQSVESHLAHLTRQKWEPILVEMKKHDLLGAH
ncbi:MAG: hypothetical protein E6Q68_01195 [Polynucleobacter sp.]|nr:MAG: hypothetical protein E6Q68_01195 [Polynucleobacter sp.]